MDLSKVFVADFETTPFSQFEKEGKTKVWLSYFENLVDPDINSMDLNIDDFFKSLMGKQENMKKKVVYTCYFHNLKFDGDFILWWLKNNDFKEYKGNGKMKSGYFNIIMGSSGQIYSLSVQLKQKMKVKFLDSYMILNKAVGDLPGSTKGIIDYQAHHNERFLHEIDPVERQYIKDDVQSVIRALRPILAEGTKGITSSAMAYNSFQDIVDRDNTAMDWDKMFPRIAHTEESYRYIRKYVRGGFTYLNPRYKNTVIDDWVISFDINSSYPAIMRYHVLPYGKPFITEDEAEFNQYKSKFQRFLYEVHVTYACIKKGHHPFLSVTGNLDVVKKYDKEIINAILYLTDTDYAMLNDYYEGSWEIRKWTCLKGIQGIFDTYIDYWLAEKIRCKEAGDKAGYLNAKLKLNQLYGKFVTDHLRVSKHPDFDTDPEHILFVKEDTVLNSRYYWYMGIFIAGDAREAVIRPIQALRENYVYCDTDSIHITTDDPEYRPDCFKYDLTKLGAWGFEGASRKSKWLKNKQYIKNIQFDEDMKPCDKKYRRIASLSRKHHKDVWFDNFHPNTPIPNGRMRPVRVRGGICLIESDLVFRSDNKKLIKEVLNG